MGMIDNKQEGFIAKMARKLGKPHRAPTISACIDYAMHKTYSRVESVISNKRSISPNIESKAWKKFAETHPKDWIAVQCRNTVCIALEDAIVPMRDSSNWNKSAVFAENRTQWNQIFDLEEEAELEEERNFCADAALRAATFALIESLAKGGVLEELKN